MKIEAYRSILKQYWGYDDFRGIQREIIESIGSGNDTLGLMPTGGGKSITFQVPALAKEGTCIVITPLIALMKDQVDNLRRRGIKAAAIYSGLTREEIVITLENCIFGAIKILYVSPERLSSELFQTKLRHMHVSFITVDEAHCISQWGYDFRPPFLEIAEIRKFFPNAPVLALTATATPEVVKDIQDKLNFKKHNVFQKSFRRENLTYYVVKEEDKRNRMLRIVQRYQGSGIIYVRNRKKSQEIAELLQRHGISADFYHAGLDNATRDRKQNEWMCNQTRIIVATNAFGMGIDKPDVRFVIHLDIPDTLESYFQEAGRGGRDEQDAVAILLYDGSDLRELRRNHELTFPPIDNIRKVYNIICNQYKIALGDGEGRTFPFRIGELLKPAAMNMVALYNSIKFLEKMGILFLNEDGKSHSQLSMSIGGEQLTIFEDKHPEHDEFIKLILRSYSGLFTKYVTIDEVEIAQRAGISEEETISLLHKLARMGLWSYSPRTEQALLTFLTPRVDEHYLYFSPDLYKRRKNMAQKRLDEVIHYVESEDTCRSQLLLAYFGERRSKACGKCDVCRKIHKEEVGRKEFETIANEVKRAADTGIKDIRQLVIKVSEKYTQEQVVKVVRWMIDSEQLTIDN